MATASPTDPLRRLDLISTSARGRSLGAPGLAPAPFQRAGRSAVYAANGMCASSHPLASSIAVEILRAGGNAVDAGVAAAFALPLLEPMMTGMGGDSFAIYAPPDGEVVGLNGSGRAPSALDPAQVRAAEGAAIGLESPNAVTVPGAVGGLCRLMERHGRFDLDRVTQPARKLAREGAPVAPRTAYDWAVGADRLSGAARRFYLKPGGSPFAPGDRFAQPGLAEVMDLIARDGAKGFYEGTVAEDMATSLAALGGAHRVEDFASASTDDAPPVGTTYRGVELLELPPNTQGVAALLMLDMLGGRDLSGLDPLGAERIHLEIETIRLAYEARNRFIADPGSAGLDQLRDPAFATRLAAQFDPDRARPEAPDAEVAAAAHRDTVYLCVVDRDGGALSLIMSLFHSFGSGLASERYGVLFQNRGAGFTLEQGHRNQIAPGKRPLHTLCPGMLRVDGQALAPFGVMGGQYQAAGHARLVSNLLDFGLDLQAAIDLPRAFWDGGLLRLESGYAPLTAETLAGKGHRLEAASGPIGGAQAIWIDRARGVLCGASDPRKDGCALGY